MQEKSEYQSSMNYQEILDEEVREPFGFMNYLDLMILLTKRP